MKLVCLAEDDFATVVQRTALLEDARMMARAVLVDRRPLPDVAKQFQVSVQRVHLAVEVVRKAYDRAKLRSGWLGVDLELPHALALDLEKLTIALHQKADSEMLQKIVSKVAKALVTAERDLMKIE